MYCHFDCTYPSYGMIMDYAMANIRISLYVQYETDEVCRFGQGPPISLQI